ncbi:hypothetical protein LTR93_003222 [Exophiala xenobiotica]|nr:hypothetical protein LTR93_003222 [Exophiala xenobiotica]KAK5405649.1 hypothetical protein LTR06_008716 [Exophiala xenobiotica]
MSDASGTLAPGASKRPRPVISCLECRRKKLKCDRLDPCQQCIKIGRPGRCTYQSGQEPVPNTAYLHGHPSKRQRLNTPAAEDGNGDTAALEDYHSPVPYSTGKGVVEDLQERVARLERALLAHAPEPDGELTARESVAPVARTEEHEQQIQIPAVSANLSSQFPDACAFMAKLAHDPDLATLRVDVKTVHHAVEMNNHTIWHEQVTTVPTGQRPLELPPLHVCERLTTLYFDNMEHCFRILHAPAFREQLKILFTDGAGEQACSFGFIPLLFGVLSIGASVGTHGECEIGASTSILHPSRVLGVMRNFLSSVRLRQRYLLPVLQVRMLVLVCQWSYLGRADDLFILSGEILRDALIMKLNQDPSTLDGISVFEGEVRRRMWMTVVEIDLMLCILCKIPCTVPPYTSRPPQNINDDEIYDGIAALPASRPTEEWTDGLCQHVLSQSFPLRLAACKQMDGTGHIKLTELLVYTRDVEKVLSDLPSPLRFSYMGDQASKTPPRLMARMELDFSIRRPLMHLYTCFAASPNAYDIQQECTDGFLQSCLMITTFQDLFDPRYSEIDVPRPEGYWDFFHNLYRHELGQAILGLCLEIKRLGNIRTDASTVDTPASASASQAPGTSTAVAPIDGGISATAPTAAPLRVQPGYTKSSLVHSVQDTLEPMKLRLAHPGANFKDIVYFTVVLTSLLPEHAPEQTKETTIRRALQDLVQDCHAQLQRDNVQLLLADSSPDALGGAASSGQEALPPPTGYSYDPVWTGFPVIELFEPLDVYDPPASNDR